MIIKKLELDAFAGFKDQTIALKPGLTVYYGPNGAGKTSLRLFIQTMLYGLDDRRRKDSLSLRQRIIPLGENQAKGSLLVEVEGRDLLISRQFGSSRRNDRCQLRWLDTGEELLLAQEPGEYFFGVSLATFLRTALVSSPARGSQDKNVTELHDRLMNLTLTGEEDAGYAKALEELEKSRRQLTTSRKTGSLDQLSQRLEDLTKQHGEAQKLRSRFKELLEKEAQWEADIKELRSRLALTKDRQVTLPGASQAQAYEEVRHIKGQLAALKSHEPPKPGLSREETQAGLERLAAMEAEQIELAAKVSLMAGEKDQWQAVAATPFPWGIWLGTLLALILLSLFSFKFLKTPWLYLVLLPLWLLVSLLLLRSWRAIIKRRAKGGQRVGRLDQDMDLEAAHRDRLGRSVKEAREELQIKVNQPLDNPDLVLATLARQEEAYRAYQNEVKSLEDRLKDLGEAASLEEVTCFITSWQALDEDRSRLTAKIQVVHGNLQELQWQKADLEGRIGALSNLDEDLAAIKREWMRQDRELRALDMALAALKESFEELKRDYLPRVSRLASHYYARLSHGQDTDLILDPDFKPVVKMGPAYEDMAYLSTGTADLVWLSLRFALYEILLKGCNSPMIFDDSFLHLDHDRLSRILRFIDEEFDHQVLILSCQERELKILEEL